jgi:hypothetical protein
MVGEDTPVEWNAGGLGKAGRVPWRGRFGIGVGGGGGGEVEHIESGG